MVVQSTLASSVQERPNDEPDVAGHETVPSSGQSTRYVNPEWLKREDVPARQRAQIAPLFGIRPSFPDFRVLVTREKAIESFPLRKVHPRPQFSSLARAMPPLHAAQAAPSLASDL